MKRTDLKLVEELQPLLPVQFDDPIVAVFEFWKAILGHERAQLGPTRRRTIRAALEMGYSVDDLRLAIVGCKWSDFHQGANQSKQVYDDVELICRNETYIDKFLIVGQRKVEEAIAKEAKEAVDRQEADKPRSPMSPEIRAKLDAVFAQYRIKRRPA